MLPYRVQDLLTATAEVWDAPFILSLPKKDQFQMPNVVIDGKYTDHIIRLCKVVFIFIFNNNKTFI